MIISSEAREAAASYFVHESYDAIILNSYRMRVDHLATAMQSLINSTLERAAGVADTHDSWVGGEIATAIRQLKEGE